MKREPIGGHHFTQYARTFKGETFGEVVTELTHFRINNNIPVGNPEQEILFFYSKHFPYMVKEDRHTPAPAPESTEYTAWRDWIYEAWRRPPKKTVTTKEASERWMNCLKCPKHKTINWIKEESVELSRRAFMLRRGIDVPKELGYCSLHCCDLSAFVFIDNSKEFSAMKDSAENLDSCWVK